MTCYRPNGCRCMTGEDAACCDWTTRPKAPMTAKVDLSKAREEIAYTRGSVDDALSILDRLIGEVG